MLKNNKGITLVALVVTIVILLILAGVSLNLVLGDNGIVRKAQEAREKTEEADAREKVEIAIAEFPLASDGQSFEEFFNSKVPKDFDEVKKNEDGNFEIKKGKYTITVDDKGNIKDVSKTGSIIKVENIKVVANSDGNGENITGQVLYNTKLYINFDLTNDKENVTVSPQIPYEITQNGDYTFTVTSEDKKKVKTVNVTVNQYLPESDITKPYLPGDEFSYKSGTNVDSGLIVYDKSGNEYVWVEVPRTGDVYKSSWLNITNFTEKDYESIEADLQTYASIYRNGTKYSDTWDGEDASNEGWFTKKEDYDTAKQNMLKSIYENGGFYVGKYEAGIEENRQSKSEKNSEGKYDIVGMAIPMSQPDKYPYTYVTRTQAEKLAESVNSGDRTSSLMFGIQWDLVLAFMAKDKTKIESTEWLTTDSTQIGNYRDSAFKLNSNVRYAVYSNNALNLTWDKATTPTTDFVDSNLNKIVQETNGNGILVTTGTSERNTIMNICDIAGNVWEWTLEKSSSTKYPCTERGGGYSNAGSASSAANRVYGGKTGANSALGFRVAIY